MQKQEYLDYWNLSLWDFLPKLYDNQSSVDLISLPCVSVNYDDFVKFSIDNFDFADQDWERQKEYFTKDGNLRAKMNNLIGYGKHNSFVLNFGKKENTTEKLKELLGKDNIAILNLIPDTILMRLIVKLPGHGFPYHIDEASSYKKSFSEKVANKAKRIWIPISPWQDGHMFQISDKIITHWKSGDVYQIPWGVPHLGVNYGYAPQLTLNITGCTYD